jgi:hypothetical protein
MPEISASSPKRIMKDMARENCARRPAQPGHAAHRRWNESPQALRGERGQDLACRRHHTGVIAGQSPVLRVDAVESTEAQIGLPLQMQGQAYL